MRTICSFIITAFFAVSCGDSGDTNPGYDGGPDSDDEPSVVAPTNPGGIPSVLSKNLVSFSFSEDKQTITVNMATLDTTPLEASFARNSSLDQAGYLAYTVQEDPLDRLFLALGGESLDEKVRAGVVADGGQFNRVLQGGFYQRDGAYDPPAIGDGPGKGQVSYAGNYAGITNISSTDGSALLPLPVGINPDEVPNLPGQPATITGIVFLNANFADNSVNGEIYNRVLVSPADGTAIENLSPMSLIIADIDSNGEFFGAIEPTGTIGNNVGNYGGTFGGEDASYVAGVTSIEEFSPNFNNELETGFFVLTQCGKAGASGICDAVEPN